MIRGLALSNGPRIKPSAEPSPSAWKTFSRTHGANATAGPALAQKLNMTENALRVAVHRLCQRYRALLREEIAQTVDNPAAVDVEIRELFTALS